MVDELGRMLIPEPIAATARCYESADIDVRNAFREQMRPLVATLTTERDRYRDAIHRIAQSDTAWESGVAAEVLNDLGYEWGERGATRQALEDEGLPDWRWMASLVMDWIRANDESMLAYIEKGKPSKEILQRRLDTSSALRSLYDVPWVKVAADRYKNAPWNARALAGTGETP